MMNNFMTKFTNFTEKHLMPLASKMANQKHLTALKDGFVFAMPFLIVGSFILLLVNLPFTDKASPLYMQWYVDLMSTHKANWVQPFYVSMGVMSLFVSFGIGYSLSNQYKLNGITGGFLTLFTFLMTSAKLDWVPMAKDPQVINVFHVDGGWMPVMDARYLDANGLFTAIIGSFIAIEIYRFMAAKKMVIKLPDSVPPAITKSFELLTPIIAVIIIFQPINNWVQSTGKMIPKLIMDTFAPLITVSDSLPAVLLIMLIVHILWFAGLHGVNVVVAIINPIILTNLAGNQAALQAGVNSLPHIFAGGFLDAFVYLGGSGATIGLAIAMARSKSEHLSAIGKLGTIPGIFNINEPIIFGAPIVMNPILFIPFLGVPMINATIAWYALKFGLVGKVVTLVPWTTPGPVAAFLATNFGISAFLLSGVLVLLSYLIYKPFVMIYEKELEKEISN